MLTGSPRAAGLARAAVALAVLGNALEASGRLTLLAGGSRLAMPTPVPMPDASAELASWWTIGAVTCGVLLLLGVVTGPAAAGSAGLVAVALAWDQQLYSNHLLLTGLLCAYLTFARSDAVFSVRSRLRGAGDAVPAWPQLLMLSQVSVCYLFGALSKVNETWVSGEVLGQQLRWPLPSALLVVLPFVVIGTELFIAGGLWFRHIRALAVLAGVGLHASIALMLYDPVPLVAFGLACLAVYPIALTRPALTHGHTSPGLVTAPVTTPA